MATGAIMKPIQPQRCARVKCISVGARHIIWTSFLALFSFGLVLLLELLYVRRPLRYGSGVELRIPVSNALLLMYSRINPAVDTEQERIQYSRINPAVDTERERIQLLLEETEFGKLSIRDVTYSFKSSGKSVQTISPLRQNLLGRVWMLPLTSRVFDTHVPKFFELAKTWLGEGDFDPAVIMQDLVQTVKKPLDLNVEYWSRRRQSDKILWQGRHRYQSCAVVGNSGILLNGSYGDQIDSNEMVIRLNNAEISQYKTHVGSKTTLSFLNSNVFLICSVMSDCWCHPYGEEVPIILYMCQAQHLMHAARCSSFNKSPLLVTHSLFDALCAAIVKWYSVKNFVTTTGRGVHEWDSVHHGLYFHYSSGMQAVVLALGICDRVEIFGFGKSANAKHHYHTEQKQELKLHDYAAEYLFYDDLVHNRTIPFLSNVGITIPPVRIFY